MWAVVDTSPLNYLILIGHVDLLPAIHGNVFVPTGVRRELLSPDAPEAVRAWAKALPQWAFEVDHLSSFHDDPALEALDRGERSAIAVALERRPSTLIIDEWPGRRIAALKGLPVTGTIGTLDHAGRMGLISFREAMRRLQATSFRWPRSLVERLLAEHDSR